MRKKWDDKRRELQKQVIEKHEIWTKTKGAVTQAGKIKIKRNALKNGYYTETLRNFRKSKRSNEAMAIERMFRKLYKEENIDNRLCVLNKICNMVSDYEKRFEIDDAPKVVHEGLYLSLLTLKLTNQTILKEIIRNYRKVQHQ